MGESTNKEDTADPDRCHYEIQISENGEADLGRKFNLCKKKNGHSKYKPVKIFSISDLPEGHQDTHVYNFVTALSGVTVKLSVNMTSPNRPEFWPNRNTSSAKVPYPMYEMRGSQTLKTGSGRIYRVVQYTSGQCPCEKCQRSGIPSNIWWTVQIYTATHVVFDSTEAMMTSVRLFYDSEDSGEVLLEHLDMDFVHVERDWCVLKSVTCDSHLGEKLTKAWKDFDTARDELYYNYKECRGRDRMAFLVSHPHGLSKQISIGRWSSREQVGDNELYSRFFYDASTCPGSSGAPVYLMGFEQWGWWDELVHSGAMESGKNFSGAGTVHV